MTSSTMAPFSSEKRNTCLTSHLDSYMLVQVVKFLKCQEKGSVKYWQGLMHETSAQGWCTGKTQRDGMEREVGGGIGMGNTCKSMADSCQCMEKPLQYCKVISLQLIKINEKKIKYWC